MILDEIVENKQSELKASKAELTQSDLEAKVSDLTDTPRDFRGALRKDGISLIAEIKRSSPSKGDMLLDVDPRELGGLYQECGARAISILTDNKYFKGSLDDLTSVRKYVQVPCLRKEFIVDPYQIYEARLAGADAILLIVRILSQEQLKEYHSLAQSLGLHVLVETHSVEEVERALDAGAHIIGVNNRNLDTLEMDLDTTMRLKKHVPGGKILVSESGIYTRDEVQQLEDCGIDAILVGQSLLTSNDIKGKIGELLGHGTR